MNSFKEVIEELLPNLTVEKKYWIDWVLKHKELESIFSENDISQETIIGSLNQLYQYIEEKENCNRCNGVDSCSNMLKGHYTKLNYTNEQFHTILVKCDYLAVKEDEDYRSNLFKSQYIPNDLLNVTFKDIDHVPGEEDGREDAYTALLEFCSTYQPNSQQKGIYLYGPLGVGKSRMMAAAANKLAEKKIPTLMIYTADFFREMKSSIQDNSLNEKIEALKNVQVLILDDIGSETISQWERDEILGAILQARMVKGLPTLYTSNLDFDGLETHLSYSNKGGEELLKAKRIMERIRYYTTAYFVDGPNRRIR